MNKRHEQAFRREVLKKVIESGQAEGLLTIGTRVRVKADGLMHLDGEIVEHIIEGAHSTAPQVKYKVRCTKNLVLTLRMDQVEPI